MYHRIAHEVQTYSSMKERLVASFPEADDDTVRDTLEGITDLHEMIAELVRSALVDQAMGEGLKARIADMKERQGRLQERVDKKKLLALEAMNEADIRKLTEPDFTASLRKGQPSLQIVSEAEIPEDFWSPQPLRLDRTALTVALKQGAAVPGAILAPPEFGLTVRTK